MGLLIRQYSRISLFTYLLNFAMRFRKAIQETNKMTLYTLIMYDITEHGALIEFHRFITEDLEFEGFQKSVYYKKGDHYDELAAKIEELPKGSDVRITYLYEKQFKELSINQSG